MTSKQSNKRIVVEPVLHKKLKLIAIENDIDLQDLVFIALSIFAVQSDVLIHQQLNKNGESTNG